MLKPSSKQPNQNHFCMFSHIRNRYTHSEKRYHSEVRQEAVQQALAAINQGKESKNALVVPLPSKRSSVMQRSSQNDGVRNIEYVLLNS